jgi:HSP20 family protein
VELKEGPKGYRLEAEVPGFRKSDLSIDFPDPRTLRLTGKRHIRNPEAEDAAGSETLSDSANTVESKSPEAKEATETVDSSASDAEVTESGNKAVEASDRAEDLQVVESEFDQEVSFTRQLTLPEGVDLKAVKASLDHGILSVVLPKLKVEVAQKVVIE